MPLSIEVIEEAPGWAEIPRHEAIIRQAIEASLRECGATLPDDAEVCLLLCDDSRIRSLNLTFRGIDKATNVLSFPAGSGEGSPMPVMLGDIAIAWETVCREALEAEKPVSDHTSHMVVHGFLHLLGFDHESDDEADQMESMEIRILAILGIDDPYSGATVTKGQRTGDG